MSAHPAGCRCLVHELAVTAPAELAELGPVTPHVTADPTYRTRGFGIPYARAHEDGSTRVTCPCCSTVCDDARAYAAHFDAAYELEEVGS